jgi:hypothetical protein
LSVVDQRSGIFDPGATPLMPWPRNPGHVSSTFGAGAAASVVTSSVMGNTTRDLALCIREGD